MDGQTDGWMDGDEDHRRNTHRDGEREKGLISTDDFICGEKTKSQRKLQSALLLPHERCTSAIQTHVNMHGVLLTKLQGAHVCAGARARTHTHTHTHTNAHTKGSSVQLCWQFQLHCERADGVVVLETETDTGYYEGRNEQGG